MTSYRAIGDMARRAMQMRREWDILYLQAGFLGYAYSKWPKEMTWRQRLWKWFLHLSRG